MATGRSRRPTRVRDDLQKALDYGDKALASAPRSLDILVSQASIAQQLKNNSKLLDYAVRGGEVYNSIGKAAKPESMSDQDFATQTQEQRDGAKTSYEFLEAAAFNVIVDETNAKARMNDIERFTPAFPNSHFDEPVASYAMMSLSELKDTTRVVAYGEKALAANPNNLPALLLLAGTYVEDPKPGSVSQSGWLRAAGDRRGQGGRSRCGPLAQTLRRSRPLHAGLRLHETGKDGGSDSGVEVRHCAAQRGGRSAVRHSALPAGFRLCEAEPRYRSAGRIDGGGENSRASPTALAGSAGQGERSPREGKIAAS